MRPASEITWRQQQAVGQLNSRELLFVWLRRIDDYPCVRSRLRHVNDVGLPVFPSEQIFKSERYPSLIIFNFKDKLTWTSQSRRDGYRVSGDAHLIRRGGQVSVEFGFRCCPIRWLERRSRGLSESTAKFDVSDG